MQPDAIITIPMAHLIVYDGSIIRFARLIQRAAKKGDKIMINSEFESWNHTVGIASIPNQEVSSEPLSSTRSV